MLVLLSLLVLALGMAVVLGFGALLAHLLPLSLYQASLLAVFTALVLVFIGFVMTLVARFPPGLSADMDDDDWEDEEDEDEDDWGPDNGKPLILQPALGREEPKAGRNSPCPCGSGKKYKNCCGDGTTGASSNAGSIPF